MKYFIFLFSSLLFCWACNSDQNASNTGQSNSQSTSTNTTTAGAEALDISVEIKNMPVGPVVLIGRYQGQNFRVDSTYMDVNGKVSFKHNEPINPGMYYVVFGDNTNLQILLDKDQSVKLKVDARDIIGTVVVEGNTDTELLYQNMKFETMFRAQIDPINQRLKVISEGTPEYQTLDAQKTQLLAQRKAHLKTFSDNYPKQLFTSFKMAGQNPEIQDVRYPDGSTNQPLQIYLYRTQFWDQVDFKDERLLYTPVISNKLKRYIEKLTPQDPDSIIQSANFLVNKVLDSPEYFKYFANFITLQYEPTKTALMDSEKVYVNMIQNYFTNERAFWADSITTHSLQLKAYEMSASLMGKKGPDVKAMDTNGQLKSIYEIKSDYVIVYLFNPTCEHCKIETPKLVEFYKTWKNKGVEVFAIAVDTNDKEWRDYVRQQKMNWINVFDPTNRSIYAKYYVDVTPEIYVLDRNRTIIAKNIKVEQIAEVIGKDR